MQCHSRFWFSTVSPQDVIDARIALGGLAFLLEFAVIGKENSSGYHKCIFIYKERTYYTAIPDILKKTNCGRIPLPFIGKGERKAYLKSLIGDVTTGGTVLQVGLTPFKKRRRGR